MSVSLINTSMVWARLFEGGLALTNGLNKLFTRDWVYRIKDLFGLCFRVDEIGFLWSVLQSLSLKMAKTTTGSNGLIPIHPNPLHLVEAQSVRSDYEPKHSIVYTRV